MFLLLLFQVALSLLTTAAVSAGRTACVWGALACGLALLAVPPARETVALVLRGVSWGALLGTGIALGLALKSPRAWTWHVELALLALFAALAVIVLRRWAPLAGRDYR